MYVREQTVAKNHFQSRGDNSPFFPLVSGKNGLWFLGIASIREKVFFLKKKKPMYGKPEEQGKEEHRLCIHK